MVRKAHLHLLMLAPIVALAAFALPGTATRESTPQVAELCPANLMEWCAEVGEVTPLIIELDKNPAVVEAWLASRAGTKMALDEVTEYMLGLVDDQNAFLSSLDERGVRAKLYEKDAKQIDGSVRHFEYRFTYTLNGVLAFVATEDVDALRALPEVAHVNRPREYRPALDNAIDYSLGTQASIAARRQAVYGAIEELEPVGSPGHPETPKEVATDGVEGQGLFIAVIDTGVDWRHPMFGGTGLLTPLPRVANEPPSADDNTKVVYFHDVSTDPGGEPTDDFGHGTLVASTAAGYRVDGSTPPNPGYGTGPDPTMPTGIGPTPNGETFHGTAPQAKILVYKVCNIAGRCLGDIALAIEDAASPVNLLAPGVPGTQPKPVADVINLSLGDTTGSSADAESRAANNAALAGTIVVTSAGNSGEDGPGTIGSPGAATLAVTVGASIDPGSVAGLDSLLTGQIPGEPATGPGPAPETGAASNANAPDPSKPQGVPVFPVAGGGFIPEGSLSARFVLFDETQGSCSNCTNRIVIADGTGAFFNIATQAAAFDPAAILIITDAENATALVVPFEIPTFSISEAKVESFAGSGYVNASNHNVVSDFPIRLTSAVTLSAFDGDMAGFSSRGPNDHATAAFRVIKPDVTGPGVAVAGAATPDGNPDTALGLASPTGYTQASGTSFSSPITAGGMVLIRQHVRNNLGLDSIDPMDFEQRFDAVTVARALLMNAATNLRDGLGNPNPNPDPVASINDMGAGHINIAGSLALNAVFLSPTTLFDTSPNEYDPRSDQSGGNIEVLIPSTSYARVPVANAPGIVVRDHQVRIRDVSGQGGGTYNLSLQNNRLLFRSGFDVTFTAAPNSAAPISSVTVPTTGSATFNVRTAGDGTIMNAVGQEIMWYATATHTGTNEKLRMPFYYRTIAGSTADSDSDGIDDVDDNCVSKANANQQDSDGDGIGNACDNCTQHANPSQCDTNGDGYGNRCDADLNNDGGVTQPDLGIFRSEFGQTGDVDSDLNCDGGVTQPDLGIFRSLFNRPPGPSGVAN